MDVREDKALTTLTVLPPKPRRESFFARLAAEYHMRARGDILLDILVGVVACLFTQTHALFGVYPFAIALLCSLRRRVLPAFAGALIGCYFLGASGVLYLIIFGIILVLRVIFSYTARRYFDSAGLFDEHPLFRVLEACLAGCAMAAYELALFGVYDYTVLFALGAVFLPTLLTFAYTALAESGLSVRALLGKEPYKRASDASLGSVVLTETGGLALLFSIVLATSRIEFFGISLGKCVITLFVLVLARRFGALRASAAGLVIALAESVTYVPSFGLLGLLSGLYAAIGMPCALAAAVIAGGGFAVYVGGLSGFLAVVPEMAVTSLLIWPFLRTLERADDAFFYGTSLGNETEAPCAKEAKAPSVARALDAISVTLAALAENERTMDEEESLSLRKRVKDGICRRCPAAGACKEEDEVLRALRDTLEGKAEGERAVCEAFPKMQEGLRREAARVAQKKRQGGAKGTFSAEYALHARLFYEAEEKKREDEREDTAAAEKILTKMKAAGVFADSVTVTGKRHRRAVLTGVRWQNGSEAGDERLHAILTEVLGAGLSAARTAYNGRRMSYIFESEEQFFTENAVATCSRRMREPSGDRAVSFSDGEGMAYAALCDGMGSGKRAAGAAEMSASVLSSLLSAGVRLKTALSLLGNLLCADEEECSVSVDLLSMDLISGRASFLKSGAAASFVQRADALFRIRAKTIPMGVVREVDSEEVHLDMQDGDLLILLSDGVMQGNEDGAWLKELLRETDTEDLSVLARTILAAARERVGKEPDDMTVLLTRISAKRRSDDTKKTA